MHGATIKIFRTHQAKISNKYKMESFKCFNVNFRLLKTVYVHLLVCYLNYKMHGATIKIELHSGLNCFFEIYVFCFHDFIG